MAMMFMMTTIGVKVHMTAAMTLVLITVDATKIAKIIPVHADATDDGVDDAEGGGAKIQNIKSVLVCRHINISVYLSRYVCVYMCTHLM